MKYLLSAILLWGVSTSCKLEAKSVAKSVRTTLKAKNGGVPHQINYQGWLGDASDTTGVTGDFDMKFRLYDDSTGGSVLWNESQNAVSVNKGIFNVLLGSQSSIPSDIFTGDPLWLETQVEDDTLSPRKKLVSVGYAIKSEEAEHSIHSDTAGYALAANVSIDSVAYADTAGYAWNADTANYAEKSDTSNYALSGVGANGWTITGNNMYSAVPGSVGVGVASPTEKLDVDGAVNVSSLYKIGGNRILSNAGTNCLFVGVGAGENNTGSDNTFSGYAAGNSNTTGHYNTFSGYAAGNSNTEGSSNTFSGYRAGGNNTIGGSNTFTGNYAGYWNTTGSANTFSGNYAGSNNTTGAYNVFLGYKAGYNNTTDSSKLYIANGSDDADVLIYGEFDNRRVGIRTTSPTAALDINGNCKADTFIGDGSQLIGISAVTDNDWTKSGNNMYSAVPGSVGVGVSSPTEKLDVDGAITVSSSYKIGGWKVLSDAGSHNIFVGILAGFNNTTGGGNTFTGYIAGYENTTGEHNTFSGTWAGNSNTEGSSNTFSGYQAGGNNTTGSWNTFSGSGAGRFNTTGNYNTFSGSGAGSNNAEGDFNTFSGFEAGSNNTGDFNTFSGFQAGYENTTGEHNTFSGLATGYSNTEGSSNTFSGSGAGSNNAEGDYNTFLGTRAGHKNTTGEGNTFSGSGAGHKNTEGAYNVFLGYKAGYNNTTDSSKLYIANDSSDANVLIYGEFDNHRVGIGTTSPTANLDVNGVDGYNQIRMRVSFTPDSTGDARGNTGDIAWDDDCIYIKTSGGWKRATLSTF